MTEPSFDEVINPHGDWEDDWDHYRHNPRHMKRPERNPIMNTLIKNTVRFIVFLGLAYAGLWLTWQFALLINTVTTQVWK